MASGFTQNGKIMYLTITVAITLDVVFIWNGRKALLSLTTLVVTMVMMEFIVIGMMWIY
jgi:hypothetical protein